MDQGFREQLMAVLQAGKALVSGGWSRPPVPLLLLLHEEGLLTRPLSARPAPPRAERTVRMTTTMRSWGTRP